MYYSGDLVTSPLQKITCLNGIGVFVNLTHFEANDQYISDASDIGSMTSICSSAPLDDLSLSNNCITDIEFLKNFGSLSTVNLSDNLIDVLKYNNGTDDISIFANSFGALSTLNLLGNRAISSNDLSALIGCTNLSSLDINNTLCDYDLNTLNVLKNVFSATLTSFSLSRNGNNYTLTKTAIETYISALSDTTNAVGAAITNGLDLQQTVTLAAAVSGVTYTISFLDTNVYGANGFTNTGDWGTNGGNFTTLVNVNSTVGTIFDCHIYMKIWDSANTEKALKLQSEDSTSYSSSMFDPAMWAYIVNNGTVDANGYVIFNPEEISITSDVGLKSLKGLYVFTSTDTPLTSITIENQKHLTETFDGIMAALTSLKISRTFITASALSGLSYCQALVTLDLSLASGIDYLAIATGDTPLVAIICRINTLKNLYVNNQYNILCYDDDGKNLINSVVAHFNYSNYLFNYTGTDARLLSSFTNLVVLSATDGSVSSVKKFYNAALVSSAKDYLFVSKRHKVQNTSDEILYRYSNAVENLKYDVTLVSDLGTDVERLNTLEKYSGGSTTLNNKYLIYKTDINTTGGVKYYLPSTFTYFGKTLTLSWTSSVASYLTTENGGSRIDISSYTSTSDSEFTLSYTLTGDGISFSGQYTFYIVANVAEVTPTNKLPLYYLELPDENGDLVLVDASTVFDSPRLMYVLFNECGDTKGSVKKDSLNRYYLPYSSIVSFTKINIDNKGIPSIDGFEIFKNLRDFIVNVSNIISIEAIKDMELNTFSYTNTNDSAASNGDVSLLTDFSPLYNSQNSLTSFKYAKKGAVFAEDLNFLTAFPKLTTVDIGLADAYSYYRYIATFNNFVYELFNNTAVTSFTFYGNTFTSYNEYAAEAAKYYDYLNTDDMGAVDFVVDWLDNFRFVYDGAALSNDGDTANFKIPAILDVGEYYDENGNLQSSGDLYKIIWKSLSSYLEVGSYTFYGRTTAVVLNGTSRTLSSGNTLTEEELNYLLLDMNFRNNKLMGYSEVYLPVTITGINKNTSGVNYITAKIKVGDYYHQKTYTINDETIKEMERLKIEDGHGVYILPTCYTVATLSANKGYVIFSYTKKGANNATNTITVLIINDFAALAAATENATITSWQSNHTLKIYSNFTAADITAVQTVISAYVNTYSGSPTQAQLDALVATLTTEGQKEYFGYWRLLYSQSTALALKALNSVE